MPKKVQRLKKTMIHSEREPAVVQDTNPTADPLADRSEEPVDGGHDADNGFGPPDPPVDPFQSVPTEEPIYSASGFWSYVDDLLVAIRNEARASGGTREEQEDVLRKYVISLFCVATSY